MTDVPPNFGGFVALWRDGKLYLMRYGRGQVQEAMQFTPLNLLQVRKTLDQMIAQGIEEGVITEEHQRQSALLPSTRDLEKLVPRERVDRIAGSD